MKKGIIPIIIIIIIIIVVALVVAVAVSIFNLWSNSPVKTLTFSHLDHNFYYTCGGKYQGFKKLDSYSNNKCAYYQSKIYFVGYFSNDSSLLIARTYQPNDVVKNLQHFNYWFNSNSLEILKNKYCISNLTINNNNIFLKPNFNEKSTVFNDTEFYYFLNDKILDYIKINKELMNKIYKNHFFMKTKLYIILQKKDISFCLNKSKTYSDLITNCYSNNNDWINVYNKTYILYLKPSSFGTNKIFYNFSDKINFMELNGVGAYRWEIISKPIDGKCSNRIKEENKTIKLGLVKEPDFIVDFIHKKIYIKGSKSIQLNESGFFFDKKKIISDKNIKQRLETLKELVAIKKNNRVVNYSELDKIFNNSLKITGKLKIIENLTNNSEIIISIKNKTAYKKNYSFIAYFSKNNNIKNIKITTIHNNKIKKYYLDLDPIIGWQFDNAPDDVKIKGAKDINVIVVNTPIIFNNGNLIVNYRYRSCNANELNLFQVQNLSGGNLSLDNKYPWKVCLSSLLPVHLKDSNITPNNIKLFKDNLGHYSKSVGKPIYLTTGNQTYWLKEVISHKSLDNYSCLASFDPTTGKIGDCGFTTNYIWVRLDKDTQPPTYNLIIPKIAHKIRVGINATDDLSGVKTVRYCVDSAGTCNPNKNYDGLFYVRCGDFQDYCFRYLRIYLEDNAGNSKIYTKRLILAASGGSCLPDCTLVPKPDRIASICDGYEGCKFYNEKAKKLCNMKVKNSYVIYNKSYLLRCPDGPLIRNYYTNYTLKISSNSSCGKIFVKQIPIVLNNEKTNLNLVFCKT